MLEIFRSKNFTSIVYGTLTVALVGGLVLTWGPGARTGSISGAFTEDCVAKVGGRCIAPRQLKAIYSKTKPQDRGGESSEEVLVRAMGLGSLQTTDAKKKEEIVQRAEARFKKFLVEGLVDRELFANEAEKLGLAVSEDELLEAVMGGVATFTVPLNDPLGGRGGGEGHIPLGFQSGKTKSFDKKAYETEAKRLLGSTEAYEEWQRRELLASKMRELIQAPVRVSEAEGLEAYLAEKSHATVETVNVKESYVAKWLPDLAAADVDAWLKDDAHKKEVDAKAEEQKKDDAPTAGRVRHILVKVSPNASPKERVAAQQKLARAWARLQAGDAFASVARAFSEDGNASKGGWYTEQDLDGFVPEFRDAAKALKAGQTTEGAVETQFGWHIIGKDDPAKADAVLAQAKKDIARAAASKARVEGKTKEIAQKILDGLKGGKKPEEAVDAAIADLTGPGKFPLAKVKERAKPEEKKADAGAPSDAGATAKKEEKKPEEAKKDDEASAKNDPEKPTILASGSFNKGGDPIPNLDGAVERLIAAFAFEGKEGDLYKEVVRGHSRPAMSFPGRTAEADEDGYLVVRLKERKLATKEEFDKERDTYMESQVASKRAEALNTFMKDLREKTKDDVKYIPKYTAATPAASAEPQEKEE